MIRGFDTDHRAGANTLRVVAFAVVLTGLTAWSGWSDRADTFLYDHALRFNHAPAADDIVIAAIDDRSLRLLGAWPWPRDLHAQLVERMAKFGARVVAFDVMFAEPARDPAADRQLEEALAAHGRVVLPVFPDLAGTGTLREVRPLPRFADAAARLGHVDVELDDDARVRDVFLRAGLGEAVWPALPLAMLDAAGVEPPATPIRTSNDSPNAHIWVRDQRLSLGFGRKPGQIRRLSVVDLLRDDAVAAGVSGRYVLVGATAAGLGRAFPTPVSGHGQPMNGVELQATVLDNLLRGHWVVPVRGFPRLAALLLVVMVPALLHPLFRARTNLIVMLAGVALVVAAALALPRLTGWWIGPAPAVVGLLGTYLVWSLWRAEIGARLLRRSREDAAAALQAIGDAVITTDADGNILYMNPVGETLSGVDADNARGRPLTSVFWSAQAHERNKVSVALNQALDEARAVTLSSHATLVRPDGSEYSVRITASPLGSASDSRRHVVLALHDMSETLSLTRQVAYQATHDTLTRLPNRELLRDRLVQAMAVARREGNGVALMFLDLDGFKYVNSSLGHPTGDELLVQLAERLRRAGRAEDTIARWEGDQFSILVGGLAEPGLAGTLAKKFLSVLGEPYQVHGRDVQIDGSIGISLFPHDATEPEDLIRHADIALHRIKQRDRNGVGFYDEDFNSRARRRLEIEQGLRKALRNGEFEIYYQPQIALSSGRVVGVEALLRWHHPARGLVLPGEFVPVAEESGLIVQIGDWVLRQACARARAWRDAGTPLQIGVNLSARQLAKEDLVESVTAAMRESGAEPTDITLEITESAVMGDTARAEALLRDLRALGIRIAIDDFGTGYASLANLKQLPIDQVKIDRSFVSDLVDDPDDAAITQAVIAMSHSMGLSVVAEGVENRAQLDFLRAHHCDEMQGFFISEAQPVDALNTWLSRCMAGGADFRRPGNESESDESPRFH